MRGYPAAVRNFSEQFVKMQVMRHTADYHPESSFDKQEVMDVIDESRDAIDGFLAAPPEDRRAFAVYLLTKVRSA